MRRNHKCMRKEMEIPTCSHTISIPGGCEVAIRNRQSFLPIIVKYNPAKTS